MKILTSARSDIGAVLLAINTIVIRDVLFTNIGAAAVAGPLVAGPAQALVRAGSVATLGVRRTPVHARLALVHVRTVVRIGAPIAGQTVARVVAGQIHAARVQMAMVAVLVALLGALVNVWTEQGAFRRTRTRQKHGHGLFFFEAGWERTTQDTQNIIRANTPQF